MLAKTAALLCCSLALCGCEEATLSLWPAPAAVSMAGAGGAAGGPPQTMEDPSLVGQWPLDTDASDARAENDGALSGGVSFLDDPERGQVLACDGVDGAVAIQNLTPVDFSYSLWLWTETPSRTGDNARLGDPILWSNVADRDDDFTLALLNDRLSYLSYSQPSTGTRSLVDGVWHHVVVTRRDGERIALYVDSALDGDGNSGMGALQANPAVYFCGNPADGRYFAGRLDDVRLYDRVLSPEEVQALYLETSL